MNSKRIVPAAAGILIAFAGCSIPDEVTELMDAQPPGDGFPAFKMTEELERISAEAARKAQPPPL